MSCDNSHDCIHHWIIESAHGPTSMGRCQRCKKEQEFANSIGTSVYNGRSQFSPRPSAPGQATGGKSDNG